MAYAEVRGEYSVSKLSVSPEPNEPFIMFNNAMGNVTNGVKEYLKISRSKSRSVMLEYYFQFSKTFEWGDKGGLLPGVIGGKSKCARKESGSRCWRVQLAWNPDGTAGVAFRLPGEKSASITKSVKKNVKLLNTGFNKVNMVLKMNSKKKRDGGIHININDKPLLALEAVTFDRKSSTSKYILRNAEYIGNVPTKPEDPVFRYILTRDLRIFQAEVTPPPPPPPSPSPVLDDQYDSFSGWDEVDTNPPALPNPSPPDAPSPPYKGESITATVKWTTGSLSSIIPPGSGRRFDGVAKELYLCSGDKLYFSWSGEDMGLYAFYSLEEYQNCDKGNLNYIKNTRPTGNFMTKPNRGGWRYFAHVTGADDGACKYGCGTEKDKGKKITGTCAQKLAVSWSSC